MEDFMMMNKKAGLLAMVLLSALASCAQDAGQDQPSQPKSGVLTVSGAEDGVSYEAEVYEYTEAVADAADLTGIISDAEPDGTGTGSAALKVQYDEDRDSPLYRYLRLELYRRA
jgi:ABC-type phosphate transport system substrate-binding protein